MDKWQRALAYSALAAARAELPASAPPSKHIEYAARTLVHTASEIASALDREHEREND